ncbi:Type II secretion system protein G [uncultured bacterium]|nr:Type II secretion system protein G [uncultured bacterium]
MRSPGAIVKLREEHGFTLVELIVVVIIIGLLAALVAPKFFGKVEQSKIKAAEAQIELFGAALDQFRLDAGRYPTSAEGLQALRTASGMENWHGPYLKKEIPSDPWGRSYIYTSPGTNDDYDIVSYGADGTAGGEGENQDVVSWKSTGQ